MAKKTKEKESDLDVEGTENKPLEKYTEGPSIAYPVPDADTPADESPKVEETPDEPK